jgi:type IV pilus assembly protein PilO
MLLSLLLVLLVAAGYYLQISDKWDELEGVRQHEFALRSEFETKQQKAANLEAYEQQLVEMQDLLQTMFRQLPGRTEMDKLLVDVSQTALAAGIDVQLFEPLTEEPKDFYAERPISIRMMGDFHQFGEFVSGVAALPRVVILTMHNVSLRMAPPQFQGRLLLEGQVKTYRYIDEEEAAQMAAETEL